MTSTAAATGRIVIENCAVATVDAAGTEYASGHVVVAGNVIESVGPGPAPAVEGGDDPAVEAVTRRIDGTGHLVTPPGQHPPPFLPVAHPRLAQNSNLFDWLVELYPTWARIDEPMVYAAASGSLAMMARGGSPPAMDHHYVFPRGSGDLLGAEIRAAAELGVRFTATAVRWTGQSDGGLPPDFAVETTEAALLATEAAIDTHHDASFGSMLRIAAGPARRFSVSTELMREAAVLARRKGCGCTPTAARRWRRRSTATNCSRWPDGTTSSPPAGSATDVWMAHCIHMNDSDIAAFARTGTGVAHCPSSNARIAAGSPGCRTCWRRGAGRARGGRHRVQRSRRADTSASVRESARYEIARLRSLS